MTKTIQLPDRRGWPVRIDGKTLDDIKEIQSKQIGTPSYSSIIAQAVEDLKRSMKPGK